MLLKCIVFLSILLNSAYAESQATTYMSFALTNSGVTKESIPLYKENSCLQYKPDCDISPSLDQLVASCEDDGNSCFRVGLLLRPTAVVLGKSIPEERSFEKALHFFEKACQKGIQEGCTYVALQQKKDTSTHLIFLSFNTNHSDPDQDLKR